MVEYTIDLTDELDNFVMSLIESGDYKDFSEVVCAALSIMQSEEQSMNIQKKL